MLIDSEGFQQNISDTSQIICNTAVNKTQPNFCLEGEITSQYNSLQSTLFPLKNRHFIPSDNLETQKMLNELTEYTNEHEMIINKRKTKAILFNRARNYDFMPHLTIEGSEPLDVVEEIKLLGVVISSDLKWRSNTTSMVKKAFTRLWILRRLKLLSASSDELLDVYQKQVRCIVWTGGRRMKLTRLNEFKKQHLPFWGQATIVTRKHY